MDEEHQFLAAQHEGVCYVAVVGRATALQCTALRRFVAAALAGGAARVQVDLRHCLYGDSTFLGTLLQFRRQCEALGADALTLLAPSPELLGTLKTMGLLRLFTIVDAPVPDGLPWIRLPAEERGRCSFDFQQNVAVAHRLLADSSETCRLRYESIADAAEQELRRRAAAAV